MFQTKAKCPAPVPRVEHTLPTGELRQTADHSWHIRHRISMSRFVERVKGQPTLGRGNCLFEIALKAVSPDELVKCLRHTTQQSLGMVAVTNSRAGVCPPPAWQLLKIILPFFRCVNRIRSLTKMNFLNTPILRTYLFPQVISGG